jgi:hypothetical protein
MIWSPTGNAAVILSDREKLAVLISHPEPRRFPRGQAVEKGLAEKSRIDR